MPKFNVLYARVVVLKTEVEADHIHEVQDDGTLPGVYEGIPTEMIPDAVQDVTDYEALWKVWPEGEEEPDV